MRFEPFEVGARTVEMRFFAIVLEETEPPQREQRMRLGILGGRDMQEAAHGARREIAQRGGRFAPERVRLRRAYPRVLFDVERIVTAQPVRLDPGIELEQPLLRNRHVRIV